MIYRHSEFEISAVNTQQTFNPFQHSPDPSKVIFYNDVMGQYESLGSFYETSFVYRDVTWRSAEHAYQAMKFFYSVGKEIDEAIFTHYKSIVNAPNAIDARRLGKLRIVPIRYDWNIAKRYGRVKDEIMFEIVLEKVKQNQGILNLLMSTGEKTLIQGNTNEPYWGVGGDGHGNNMLGRIYMIIRKQIKEEQHKADEKFA
jgi:GTP cyclohydrolase II